MRRMVLLSLMAAAGCAGRSRPADESPRVPTAAEQALVCATDVARSGGFRVRPRDPRAPLVIVAERGGTSNGMTEVIVVRVNPGIGSDESPVLNATVQGPRLGGGAGSDVEATARRIESRCGADGSRPSRP